MYLQDSSSKKTGTKLKNKWTRKHLITYHTPLHRGKVSVWAYCPQPPLSLTIVCICGQMNGAASKAVLHPPSVIGRRQTPGACTRLKRNTSGCSICSTFKKTSTCCASFRSKVTGEERLPAIFGHRSLIKTSTCQKPIFEQTAKLKIKEITIFSFIETKSFLSSYKVDSIIVFLIDLFPWNRPCFRDPSSHSSSPWFSALLSSLMFVSRSVPPASSPLSSCLIKISIHLEPCHHRFQFNWRSCMLLNFSIIRYLSPVCFWRSRMEEVHLGEILFILRPLERDPKLLAKEIKALKQCETLRRL